MVTGASENQKNIQRTVEEMQQELNKNKLVVTKIENILIWSTF